MLPDDVARDLSENATWTDTFAAGDAALDWQPSCNPTTVDSYKNLATPFICECATGFKIPH